MKVTGITISGYKSLQGTCLQSLGQFNVLVGKNNSGKSAILEAMSMLPVKPWETRAIEFLPESFAKEMTIHIEVSLSELESGHIIEHYFQGKKGHKKVFADYLSEMETFSVLKYIFWKAVGSNEVVLREIRFSTKAPFAKDGYFPLLQTKGTPRDYVITQLNLWVSLLSDYVSISNQEPERDDKWTSELLAKTLNSEDYPEPPVQHIGAVATGDLVKYLPTDISFPKIARIPARRRSDPQVNITSNQTLAADGRNATKVLSYWRSADKPEFKKLIQFIKQVQPEVSNVVVEELTNQLIESRVHDSVTDDRFPLHQTGYGIEQTLLLGIQIFGTDKIDLWLIDEPEVSLHPAAQTALAQFLKDEFKGKQVMFATHSVQLMDPQFEPTIQCIQRDANGSTQARLIASDSIVEAYHLLGQKPGLFTQADILVFVEGPTDVPVIEGWIQKMLEKENLANNPSLAVLVVNLGGDSYITEDRLTPDLLKKIAPHPLVLIDGESGPKRASREKIRGDLLNGGVHCTLTQRYAVENYFTLEAIQAVYPDFPTGCPTDVSVRNFAKEQNVEYSKKKNGSIAAKMSIDYLKQTDIWNFFEELLKTCRKVLTKE